MKINDLTLEYFRNHKNLKLKFEKTSTLIIGDNGSGKTNILEAVHLLSTTKSLRTKYDREMIAHGEKIARIEANVVSDGDKNNLELYIVKSEKFENASTKKVKVNGVSRTLQNFAGNLNSVLFSSSDIEIFSGSPSVRRKYLDQIFFQIDNKYARAHKDYSRAVRQRNKLLELLRGFGEGGDQINYWDEKIISIGSFIQKKREELFDFFQSTIGGHAEKLNEVKVEYKIEYLKNEVSEKRIEKYKNKEIAAAATLVGPHRDDFAVLYNGFDISSFGSRGEQRATILAFKLCEIDFIEKCTGFRPVLLLDDIFSELDQPHRDAVKNILPLQQTVITATDESKDLGAVSGLSIIKI